MQQQFTQQFWHEKFFQNFFSPNRLRFITNILLLELNKGLDWERGEKEFFDRLLTIFYAPNAHSSSVRHELNWHQGVVYPMRETETDLPGGGHIGYYSLGTYLVWKERFLSTKAVYMYLLHSLLPGTTPNLSWHIYKEYNARNFGYFLWLIIY